MRWFLYFFTKRNFFLEKKKGKTVNYFMTEWNLEGNAEISRWGKLASICLTGKLFTGAAFCLLHVTLLHNNCSIFFPFLPSLPTDQGRNGWILMDFNGRPLVHEPSCPWPFVFCIGDKVFWEMRPESARGCGKSLLLGSGAHLEDASFTFSFFTHLLTSVFSLLVASVGGCDFIGGSDAAAGLGQDG